MAEVSRPYVATRTSTMRASHVTSDSKQVSVGMTATLFAQLDGQVPQELIAEIVRTVLDESRQDVQPRAAEVTMLEARRRLERFIRAGLSR